MQMYEYQNEVDDWMYKCFDLEIINNKTERNYRFLEEALELVQSLGCTKDDALKLVEYVFNRPLGESNQEVGGVMVTLSALCTANELDLNICATRELQRINQMI